VKLRALGISLIVGGIIVATYGFSTLNSLEFGPAGYLCPAHACTFKDIIEGGDGGYLELSYAGLAFFAAGMAILGGSLAIKVEPGLRD